MNDAYGYGIIGCGWVASAHAWGVQSLVGDGVRLVGVSDKDITRADEIGRRFGASMTTPDYHELLADDEIEAVSICLVGGVIGLTLSWLLCTAVAAAFPSFPLEFSVGLVITGLFVSTLTGIFSGFAPALTASRLDPIEALRYE